MVKYIQFNSDILLAHEGGDQSFSFFLMDLYVLIDFFENLLSTLSNYMEKKKFMVTLRFS